MFQVPLKYLWGQIHHTYRAFKFNMPNLNRLLLQWDFSAMTVSSKLATVNIGHIYFWLCSKNAYIYIFFNVSYINLLYIYF